MKIQATIVVAGLLAVSGLMGCESSRQHCCSCQSTTSSTYTVMPTPSEYEEAPAPSTAEEAPVGEEAPPAPNTEPEKLPAPSEAKLWRARPVIR